VQQLLRVGGRAPQVVKHLSDPARLHGALLFGVGIDYPETAPANGTPEPGTPAASLAVVNTHARITATRQLVQPEMIPGDEAVKGTPGTGEDVCAICRGTGRVGPQPYKNCDGTGKVVEGVGGA
jgi:hypothetical protein